MAFDIVSYTQELLRRLNDDGVQVRALGGVAVALRCPSARRPPLAREYHDLDLATTRESSHALAGKLVAEGFEPAERFNALHGHSRMMFTQPGGMHLDVLVDEFVMCHKLDLRGRLALDEETMPIADLLLTKLQIAQINHKDVLDVVALLIDQPLVEDEAGINWRYVVKLLSGDWGWWRTVTANLEVVEELLPSLGLDDERASAAAERLAQLSSAIESGKRSLRWKTRARLGERVPWRFDPEEVAS